MRNTPQRYGAVAQLFHWTIVVLVLGQFILGLDVHGMPVSILRLKLLVWHKSLGATVFALVVLRLLWRWYTPAPPLPAGMTPRHRRLAQAGHATLYILLLVMPLIGWISSSASNLTVNWFFLVKLPNLVGPDPQLAEAAKELHMALSWVLLATVIGHVAAAFWHELVLKDGLLSRMLPLPAPRDPKERP